MVRGAMLDRGRFVCSATTAVSTILASVGARLATLVLTVSTEMTE